MTGADAAYQLLRLNGITDVNEVMVFNQNVSDNDLPTKYVPFSGGAEVLINSNNVALSFDNNGTNLTSVTVHSAIKELDKKVGSAGGGTVTSVNGINPQGGEVTLTATVTQNVGQDIVLRVGNQDFATLQCMTDQDANTIIAGFTL